MKQMSPEAEWRQETEEQLAAFRKVLQAEAEEAKRLEAMAADANYDELRDTESDDRITLGLE